MSIISKAKIRIETKTGGNFRKKAVWVSVSLGFVLLGSILAKNYFERSAHNAANIGLSNKQPSRMIAATPAPIDHTDKISESSLKNKTVGSQNTIVEKIQVGRPDIDNDPVERSEMERINMEAALARIEQIKAIPGAEPLVTEILTFLENDKNKSVSLQNIPVDKNGLTPLNPNTISLMIKDDKIREKFEKLVLIMVRHSLSNGKDEQ